MHDVFHALGTLFLHHAATIADKHGRAVRRLVEQVANHITIGGFHFMDKTLFEQKIQRAVDGGRFGLWFRFAQQIEQIVCADGTLLQTHQAQHFEALRRQAHVALRAEFFSLRQ